MEGEKRGAVSWRGGEEGSVIEMSWRGGEEGGVMEVKKKGRYHGGRRGGWCHRG